jgi:hypothetical protein
MRVRGHPSTLAAQMGVALDLPPRIKFARSRALYEQLGAILGRSLRRVLWAGSRHAGHADWAGAAQGLKSDPAQANQALERQPEGLARG